MRPFLFTILLLCCSLYLDAQNLRVDFITPDIVRVRWGSDPSVANGTGMCVYEPQDVKVKKKESTSATTYTSSDLIVEVSKPSQQVRFIDRKSGRVLCAEDALRPHAKEKVVKENVVYDDQSARTVETANGKVTVKDILRRDTIGKTTKYQVSFTYQGDKALYGLGCNMEDYMNLKGKTVYLTQHNLKIAMPVIVSTNGYGLLFDAGCAMKYSPSDNGGGFSMELDAAQVLDYYFIKGEHFDDVARGYRHLTGEVSLMPRYLFGYIQSKERYVSSDDLINTVKEYRRRHVPLDMIVQDWNYWPEGWGYMKMNRKYYPDPKALADSIHAMNAKLMVSIWSNPQYCPEEKDFRARGMMLEHSVYDAFNPEARKLYWQYANDEFFSNGFDAWWCDSTEPVDGDWGGRIQTDDGTPYGWDNHEQRWKLSKEVLSETLGAERSNLFSLYHSKGIYENQRATSNDKRVVNLTRSGYPGQQRYGTVVWNGDTHASWKSFRQQIPAGLNYMATGNPYWSVDVGCFFVRNDGHRWFYKGEFQDGVKDDRYKEFYTRMFQWATFLPVLRSHGTDTPREIWQFGNGQYYDAILKMIRLRYQLLPTIYSMAARTSFDGYTMARMLAFDFADDERVLDIKDEYMFGDMLVCPVTEEGATSRSVYLPKGTEWVDYWTLKRYDGGQTLQADAPIDRLPLYVRAGSIMVTGPTAEYAAAQYGKTYTIDVTTGKDAQFSLYEDEGDNYNFEKGACSRIPITWNEKSRKLTIGKREGTFPGMVSKREFIVVIDGKVIATVKYDGSIRKIKN